MTKTSYPAINAFKIQNKNDQHTNGQLILQLNDKRTEVANALRKNQDYLQGNFFGKKLSNFNNGVNYINNKQDPENLVNRVKEFNKTYDENMSVFKELKEENEYFSTKYDLSKRKKEDDIIKKNVKRGK